MGKAIMEYGGMRAGMNEQKPHGHGPLVSIIIPARNEEEHLPALLASLAALKFSREQLEILVIDHESTDNTRSIAERNGVRVLTHQADSISAIRNFGASVASGQILAFLDADCTVAEDWLSRALPHFTDPHVGAVGSYHFIPHDPSTWVRKVLRKQIEARPRLAEVTWLPSGNMLVRRQVFFECLGFDESLSTCEDVDLSYRIAQKYRLIADMDIRCWHHGEPKTLWELFRKELWRGRDNFFGVLRHGLRPAELPSIFLPINFVGATILFVVSPLVMSLSGWGLWFILVTSAALLLPLLAVAVLMSARCGDLRFIPHFVVFYAVYFLARGIAPFHEWRNV